MNALEHVLVTGAGRGLGLEMTRQLLERGARVWGTVRDPSRADTLRELAERAGGQLRIEELDVADVDSIARLAHRLAEQTDQLDCLINNAGVNSRGVAPHQANVRFGTLEPTGIERMIRVNAIGPLLLTQALASLLAASSDAVVVCVSSWLGSIGAKTSGGNYGYCASKATLNMLGRAMAWDLAASGVKTVLVNPGWVSTKMGGPKARLTPQESVAGILEVIQRVHMEDTGRFLQWDGSEHEW